MQSHRRPLSGTSRLAAPLALTLLFTSAAGAATITVDVTTDGVVVDGDCTLREAVAAANDNVAVDACAAGDPGLDHIVLDAGVHALVSGGDLDITEDLLLTGIGRDDTILDGSAQTDRVLAVHAGATVEVRALTVTGGLFRSSDASAPHGGGILNEGTLALRDVAVVGNEVYGRKVGGSSQSGSSVFGGGIYSTGSLTIERSRIDGNTARGGDAAVCNNGLCSGLWREGGTGSGGGLYLAGPTTIVDSTVSGNLARYGRGKTGSQSGFTWRDGEAYGGGIYLVSGATLALERSTVSGNVARPGPLAPLGLERRADGGGIWSAGELLVRNGTVAGNALERTSSISSVGCGGGLRSSGTTTIESSSFARNLIPGIDVSFFRGGAICRSGGSVTLANTLVVDAPDTDLYLCNGIGSGASLGGNLTSPSNGCGLDGPDDLPNVAPGELALGELLPNGGATDTMALGEGSAALDAGLSAACPALDQRGLAREDGGCDIGAYELGATGCVDVDGDGYGSAGLAACAFPEPDCDDADPAVNPGAAEIPFNGIDDDCDPSTPVDGCASVADDGAAAGSALGLGSLLAALLAVAFRSGRARQ